MRLRKKLETEVSYADIKRLLVNLNKDIKLAMPNLLELIKIDRVGISEIKEGYLEGKAIKRVIIILRSTGCAWSLKEEGGCLMCGHLCGTSKGIKISAENFVKQLDHEMGLYNFKNYPMLCVYNSGSFFNTEEIPAKARKYIFNKINNTNGIKRLIIESRPEFITDDILDEIENLLPNIEVEIGVGLETSNDIIRDLCMNKGFDANDFIKLANRMKKRKTKLLTYVLLKPPFITESEAIEDACRTIKFAFNVGTDIVSLEPVSIQDFTIINFLYEAGYYRCPWIWSVLEVIKRSYKLGFVRLGGFEFFPLPKIFTHNCEKCNEKMIRAIQDFNRTYNINVFDNLSCSCKKYWEHDLKFKAPSLANRILKTLKSINKERIINRMKMNYNFQGSEYTNTHDTLN